MSPVLIFKIQILSDHNIAYFVIFDSPIWTLKSDIIRRSYEFSDSCSRSGLSLPKFYRNFTFCFMSLSVKFEIKILTWHIIAYFVSFQSPILTLKSNIIRRSYNSCDACGRSCVYFFIIAYFVSFDSLIWILKSDIIRGSYELSYASGHSCLSPRDLWHNFTFFFTSLALSFRI